jgi:hypothetical protein
MIRVSVKSFPIRALALSTVLLASAPLLCAQRLAWYERMILLPAPRKVSGWVLDPDGAPIAGAHIDHSDVREPEQLFTDELGRFYVETRAPALVIRKQGFDGHRITTEQPGPLRITLQRAAPLRACKSACVGLKGLRNLFCLPSIPGIHISEQGQMGESVMREIMISTSDGLRELLFGGGPNWSLGIPYTGDVWESSDYSEKSYTAGDVDVIDARGKATNGKLWRYVGTFGESAAYYEVDPGDAVLPDKLLDGVCAGPSRK